MSSSAAAAAADHATARIRAAISDAGQRLLAREDSCDRPRSQQPLLDGLHDVQVVLHIIDAAIIWQTVEERANSFSCGHMNSALPAPSIRLDASCERAKQPALSGRECEVV